MTNVWHVRNILGYLQGRIAADIISIYLLPVMIFYSLCSPFLKLQNQPKISGNKQL